MTLQIIERDTCDIQQAQENQVLRLTAFSAAGLAIAAVGEFVGELDIKQAGLAVSTVTLLEIGRRVFKYDL